LAPDFVVFSEHGLQPGTGAVHNVQRPETFEALFVLWRVTGKPMYREWAWSMFQSFDRECKVRCSPKPRSQSWLNKCGCAVMSGVHHDVHSAQTQGNSSSSKSALAYLSGACLCSTQVAQSGGYAGVMDVTALPVVQDDTMQSFWLAETLKYAWLMFAPPDALDLRTHVLNTEVRMPAPNEQRK